MLTLLSGCFPCILQVIFYIPLLKAISVPNEFKKRNNLFLGCFTSNIGFFNSYISFLWFSLSLLMRFSSFGANYFAFLRKYFCVIPSFLHWFCFRALFRFAFLVCAGV